MWGQGTLPQQACGVLCGSPTPFSTSPPKLARGRCSTAWAGVGRGEHHPLATLFCWQWGVCGCVSGGGASATLNPGTRQGRFAPYGQTESETRGMGKWGASLTPQPAAPRGVRGSQGRGPGLAERCWGEGDTESGRRRRHRERRGESAGPALGAGSSAASQERTRSQPRSPAAPRQAGTQAE